MANNEAEVKKYVIQACRTAAKLLALEPEPMQRVAVEWLAAVESSPFANPTRELELENDMVHLMQLKGYGEGVALHMVALVSPDRDLLIVCTAIYGTPQDAGEEAAAVATLYLPRHVNTPTVGEYRRAIKLLPAHNNPDGVAGAHETAARLLERLLLLPAGALG